MKLSLFDFELPEACIATHPVEPRDAAKLLHVEGDALGDRVVKELPDLLNAGDILVFNDSKVIPARLFGVRGEMKVELLLHQTREQGGEWTAFARPTKRLREGDTIQIAEGFSAELVAKQPDGQVRIRFNVPQTELFARLQQHGHMPLPPYIKRPDEDTDKERYQTVYAREEGSVAAPTAGLHFTPDLLERLKAKGVQLAYVTLHVGAGTFQPVKVEDTDDHQMHSEWATISAATAEQINAARAAGGKVIAVGTTSLRILETVADEAGDLRAFSGATNIFITPGYAFKIVDRLMTNFHLPKSTLFMLVSAFVGLDKMQRAYKYARENGYRFYSYGDSSLLEKGTQ